MSFKLAAISLLLCTSVSVATAATSVETIVFVRHGEKPTLGLGQITCQGLNRALALPGRLYTKYGAPTAIFAPDPAATKVRDQGGDYYYVRPLATIEPTAIQFGLPVNTHYGFTDVDDISTRLTTDSTLQNAMVFVAWEHGNLVKIVKKILSAEGGDSSQVPSWSNSDYDSIYVVRITTNSDDSTSATFAHDFEDLDGQSATCPMSIATSM